MLNPHLTLTNLGRFFVDPSLFAVTPDKAMYRPALLVTYALNRALGGWHLTNVAIQAAAALSVWWLARTLLGSSWALLAGLLFAVHPLGTEPANYVSARSESLAGLCYLLAVGLHVRGRCAVVPFVLGLFVKSICVTVPVVLLAYDWLVAGRVRWRRHLGYGVLVGGYLSLIWVNGFLSGSLRAPVRDETTQLLTQVKAGGYYLWLLAFPARLNVEHQFFAWTSPATWAAALLLVSVVALVVWKVRGLPLFLLIWGTVVLLPTVVVPLNVLVNEHRLYVTVAVWCLGLAWALSRLPRATVAVVAVYALLVLGRNPTWASERELWTDAARKAPLMPRTHLHLGNALKDEGRWDEARAAYQRAIDLRR